MIGTNRFLTQYTTSYRMSIV